MDYPLRQLSRRAFCEGALMSAGFCAASNASGATLLERQAKLINGGHGHPLNEVREIVMLATDWLFSKETQPGPPTTPPQAMIDYDDRNWASVGVPHCYNELDSFENAAESQTLQTTVWYRKNFQIDSAWRGRKIFLEFQGVNIAAAVYVNARFKQGNTKVVQPGQVTHVGDFLPFVLDITDDIDYGGTNLLAVRVANVSGQTPYGGNEGLQTTAAQESFYTVPGFGTYLGFGMGFGGIVAPVSLHVVDRVHVPFDAYSPLNKWGTYLCTLEASQAKAKVFLQTNVENEHATNRSVSLRIRVLDTKGSVAQDVSALPVVITAGEAHIFEQNIAIQSPRLWYPNNSPYGEPYLYTVVIDVLVDGAVVDRVCRPLGIRTIDWDDDYAYINDKKHLLTGFGNRNIYPALGAAVPAELQWKDVYLIAACGGSALRVGHVPATIETVKACDAYGVLVIQDSGDNEWSLYGEPAITYKREYDRDMLVSFRNHPSVAVWESNNGLAKKAKDRYSVRETFDLVQQWDWKRPRIVESRDQSDFFPKRQKLMIGYTNAYKKVEGSPSIDLEVYGARWGKGERSFGIARFDYADEKQFADYYVTNYLENTEDRACGWISWMLAETQGESYVIYLNGMSKQKSLGSSAMDGNRFPKITYEIYKNALWIPFAVRPGVTLQSNWNLSGIQDIDAWSNCPAVNLLLNGISLGVRRPDAKKRCTWSGIAWESGTLKAIGLDQNGNEVCSNVRRSSGEPHRVVLTVEPNLTKPSGETFKTRANGSDATILTARIVDHDGIWCPLAGNVIRFSLRGPATYRGSYNFYVTPGEPLSYHAPGDLELQAEGGLMRIAIRSTFQPGLVEVTASAEELISGEAAYRTEPLRSRPSLPL